MTDGEEPRRPAGSLLPVSLYADLGLKRSAADTADALVALALEEHLVWAGIRLWREPVGVSYRVVRSDIDRIGRIFVTNDRLDADLAPRNEFV